MTRPVSELEWIERTGQFIGQTYATDPHVYMDPFVARQEARNEFEAWIQMQKQSFLSTQRKPSGLRGFRAVRYGGVTHVSPEEQVLEIEATRASPMFNLAKWESDVRAEFEGTLTKNMKTEGKREGIILSEEELFTVKKTQLRDNPLYGKVKTQSSILTARDLFAFAQQEKLDPYTKAMLTVGEYQAAWKEAEHQIPEDATLERIHKTERGFTASYLLPAKTTKPIGIVENPLTRSLFGKISSPATEWWASIPSAYEAGLPTPSELLTQVTTGKAPERLLQLKTGKAYAWTAWDVFDVASVGLLTGQAAYSVGKLIAPSIAPHLPWSIRQRFQPTPEFQGYDPYSLFTHVGEQTRLQETAILEEQLAGGKESFSYIAKVGGSWQRITSPIQKGLRALTYGEYSPQIAILSKPMQLEEPFRMSTFLNKLLFTTPTKITSLYPIAISSFGLATLFRSSQTSRQKTVTVPKMREFTVPTSPIRLFNIPKAEVRTRAELVMIPKSMAVAVPKLAQSLKVGQLSQTKIIQIQKAMQIQGLRSVMNQQALTVKSLKVPEFRFKWPTQRKGKRQDLFGRWFRKSHPMRTPKEVARLFGLRVKGGKGGVHL